MCFVGVVMFVNKTIMIVQIMVNYIGLGADDPLCAVCCLFSVV